MHRTGRGGLCRRALLICCSFLEPQNKRTPDLPEEECVKGETKENDESVKQLFEDASREFEEAVVCQFSLLISPPSPEAKRERSSR